MARVCVSRVHGCLMLVFLCLVAEAASLCVVDGVCLLSSIDGSTACSWKNCTGQDKLFVNVPSFQLSANLPIMLSGTLQRPITVDFGELSLSANQAQPAMKLQLDLHHIHVFNLRLDGPSLHVRGSNVRISSLQMSNTVTASVVVNATHVHMEDISIQDSARSGLQFSASASHSIVERAYIRNCNVGVYFDDGSTNNTVANSVLSSNVHGVYDIGTSNSILDSLVKDNTDSGIVLQDSKWTRVHNCSFLGNKGTQQDISVSATNAVITSCTFGSLSRQDPQENTTVSIRLQPSSENTQIGRLGQGNTFFCSGCRMFILVNVFGTNNTLQHNTFILDKFVFAVRMTVPTVLYSNLFQAATPLASSGPEASLIIVWSTSADIRFNLFNSSHASVLSFGELSPDERYVHNTVIHDNTFLIQGYGMFSFLQRAVYSIENNTIVQSVRNFHALAFFSGNFILGNKGRGNNITAYMALTCTQNCTVSASYNLFSSLNSDFKLAFSTFSSVDVEPSTLSHNVFVGGSQRTLIDMTSPVDVLDNDFIASSAEPASLLPPAPIIHVNCHRCAVSTTLLRNKFSNFPSVHIKAESNISAIGNTFTSLMESTDDVIHLASSRPFSAELDNNTFCVSHRNGINASSLARAVITNNMFGCVDTQLHTAIVINTSTNIQIENNTLYCTKGDMFMFDSQTNEALSLQNNVFATCTSASDLAPTSSSTNLLTIAVSAGLAVILFITVVFVYLRKRRARNVIHLAPDVYLKAKAYFDTKVASTPGFWVLFP